jgi:hypothetical protein
MAKETLQLAQILPVQLCFAGSTSALGFMCARHVRLAKPIPWVMLTHQARTLHVLRRSVSPMSSTMDMRALHVPQAPPIPRVTMHQVMTLHVQRRHVAKTNMSMETPALHVILSIDGPPATTHQATTLHAS